MVSATWTESVQKARDPGLLHRAAGARGEDPELNNAAERGSCDQIGRPWHHSNESTICDSAVPGMFVRVDFAAEIVNAYWAAANNREWGAFERLLADDVVYEGPQTRERVAVRPTTSGSTSRASRAIGICGPFGSWARANSPLVGSSSRPPTALRSQVFAFLS
jgi:hypothetical protein